MMGNDICFCGPEKYLPKCKTCKRRYWPKEERISVSDFYNSCKDGKYEYYWEKRGLK